MINLYSTDEDEAYVAPAQTARPDPEDARASRPDPVPNRDPVSDTRDDGDGDGDDTQRRRRRAAASPRVSDPAPAPVVVSPRNARARPKRASPASAPARRPPVGRNLFPAPANASDYDDEDDDHDARGARPSARQSALEALETHPTDYDDSDDDSDGGDGDDHHRHHNLDETIPRSARDRDELRYEPGDASRRESPQDRRRSEDGGGSGGFRILRRVGGAVASAAGGAVATVAGAAAEGAYVAVRRISRGSADLDGTSPATASLRDSPGSPRSSPSLDVNRRARGRWRDARRLVSADLAREYPSGPNGDGSLPSSTFGWLIAKSRDAVRAAADGTSSLVRASSSRLRSRPRARKVGRARSFAQLSPDEMIPEKDRLPPVRPRAPLGGPRGRQLWKKVRDNRLLLIGEGVGTGSSSYWRRRAGVTAFLFSVDMDINGRRKSKAEMLNRAAAKLKKSTKFPRSEAFDRELAELELTQHQIHKLCKEQRMKIRDGPNPIKPSLLKVRLLHLMHGKYGNDWFEPTPFGRNWRGYWMPLVLALVQCFMISFVTVGVTYAAYTLGEHWHHAYRCDKIWNWMNPQCQVADFVRTNAKQWVYKWYYQVGSVIAMRAGAWADALSKEAGKMAVEATEKMSEKLHMDGGGGGGGGYVGNGDEDDE